MCLCVCLTVRLELGKESNPQVLITFLLNVQYCPNHCKGGRVPVPECIWEDKIYLKRIESSTRQSVFKLNMWQLFWLDVILMAFRERKSHWALGTKGNLGQWGEGRFPKGYCGPNCRACTILHKEFTTWISAENQIPRQTSLLCWRKPSGYFFLNKMTPRFKAK